MTIFLTLEHCSTSQCIEAYHLYKTLNLIQQQSPTIRISVRSPKLSQDFIRSHCLASGLEAVGQGSNLYYCDGKPQDSPQIV